jgi:hypothetical protein
VWRWDDDSGSAGFGQRTGSVLAGGSGEFSELIGIRPDESCHADMEQEERQLGWTEQAQRVDRTKPHPANQPDGAFV